MSVYDSRRPTARYSLPELKRTYQQQKSSENQIAPHQNHSLHETKQEENAGIPKNATHEKQPAPKMQRNNLLNLPQLNRLKLDNDKLIILALMAILIKEGADMKLIAALAYILL